MRIVAGKNRGTKLIAPQGLLTRPTSDRTRESLFNILSHRYAKELEDASVLDVFAGSGALGLEALSRGAGSLLLLEHDRKACVAIKQNIEACHAKDRARLIPADCLKPPLAPGYSTLIFMDPPYHAGLAEPALKALIEKGWIVQGALLLLELGPRDHWEMRPGFEELDHRQWGKAHFYFLRITDVRTDALCRQA